MNENNIFKITLSQENVLLCEKIFNADYFSPFTRYSVDVRYFLPKTINKLQKILSRRNYDYNLYAGEGKSYNSNKINQSIIESYSKEYQSSMRYNPKEVIQHVIDNSTNEERTIRGVECKLGLYINNKPIVERLFYVDGYNNTAIYSVDLLSTFLDVCDFFENHIKKTDVKNMWDDYLLINKGNMPIDKIRELTISQREEFLRRIK